MMTHLKSLNHRDYPACVTRNASSATATVGIAPSSSSALIHVFIHTYIHITNSLLLKPTIFISDKNIYAFPV